MAEADVNCTFCHHHKADKAYDVTDIYDVTRQLYICRNCKTWFLWPKPSPEELERAYGKDYYGEQEKKFKWNIVEDAVDFFRKKRALNISSLTEKKGCALDIGCGNGRFLHFLSMMGKYELHGTELPGNSAERAKDYPEIKLFEGAFENTDFQANYFDCITLFHVFEHLNDPGYALEKVFKILKKNGVLIFSFPNIRSFQSKILKQNWLHLDPPRHLFFPDPQYFVSYLKSRGYTLLSKRYFSPEQNPFGMVQGLLNFFSGKRDVLFEQMKGNDAYAKDFSKGRLLAHKMFFIFSMPWFMIGDALESMLKMGATIELTFRKD